MTTATAHHEPPADIVYVKVAFALAVLTGFEVAMPYLTDMKGPVLVLMVSMMTVKFGVVALWFMHLRFDSLLFRRLFLTGLILAIFVYTIVFVSMQYWGDDTTSQPLDELPAPASIRS